jgi:hypothetical protein
VPRRVKTEVFAPLLDTRGIGAELCTDFVGSMLAVRFAHQVLNG